MRDLMRFAELNVQSMDHIAAGVTGLRIIMVNAFAVANRDGSWVLIDTGMPFCAERIRRWAERQLGPDAKPSCILLTHGHFDHVGSVVELASHWNVPIYAHRLEKPYLTGASKYPPPDPTVGGGVFSLMCSLYSRGPIDISDRLRELPEDQTVPGLAGWRWIPTPGHSPGHVSFFRDEDRVLIAGDAFVTTKQESLIAVATQRPQLHGPPAYFTMDWGAAELSVGRLAGLQPNIVACGHGLPLAGPEVASALDYLAEHFTDVARPVRGRYVRRPAVADENGVIHIPPPIIPTPIKAAAGAALFAGAVWYGMSRVRKKA